MTKYHTAFHALKLHAADLTIVIFFNLFKGGRVNVNNIGGINVITS